MEDHKLRGNTDSVAEIEPGEAGFRTCSIARRAYRESKFDKL